MSRSEGALAAVDAFIRNNVPQRCNCRRSCSRRPLPVGTADAPSNAQREYIPHPRGPPPRLPPSIAEEIAESSPLSILDTEFQDDSAVGCNVAHISGTSPSIEEATRSLTAGNISTYHPKPTRIHPNADVFDMATSSGSYVVLQVTLAFILLAEILISQFCVGRGVFHVQRMFDYSSYVLII